MIAIRISVVLGLAVFGILLLYGMDTLTALFRGFIVFMGMAALLMIFRYVSNVINPPPPPPPPDEENDE